MSKAKQITNEIVENTNTQRVIFKSIVGGLVLLSIIYVYLIGSITFNVLARKSLETSVHSLGNEVSQLELTYLSEANKIDKNYALSLGFVDLHQNIFAARDSARVALR
jgi:hypothetical protein